MASLVPQDALKSFQKAASQHAFLIKACILAQLATGQGDFL